MELLNCTEPPLVKKLGNLVDAEAWLISFKIYCGAIEIICDINSINKIDFKKYIKYKFNDVMNVKLQYDQNIFSKIEDDISEIDFVRVSECIDCFDQNRWKVEFLLSYGKLDFTFRSFDMKKL
jgi:hypothetical protein